MARKVDYLGVLQVTPRQLSYLRASRSGPGLTLTGQFVLQGSWSAEDGSLAAALTGFVADHGIAGDEVYVILPRHEITCRVVSLPSHNPAELRSMVALSAEEYVPYAAEELIVDQALLRKLDSGESEILAVFAHKDVVEQHLSMLRKAGIEPEQILLSTACLVSALAAASGVPHDRYALVELGSSGFEVDIVQDQQLRYTRGIAGAHEWTGMMTTPGGPIDELAIELRSSLSAYRRESPDGLGVEHIYFSADTADFETIAQALAQETGKECAPAHFVRSLVTGGLEHIEGRLPLVALGGLLTARGEAVTSVSLLPEEVEQDRALLGAKYKLTRAALMALLVLVGLGAVYLQAIYQRGRLLRELQVQRDAIAPQAEGVAEKREQLRILRQQVDDKGTVLELLATITAAAPEDSVNITRFNYERDAAINLWGRAKTIDDVHHFTQNIRGLAVGHLALLSQAQRIYENVGSERGQTIYDYQVAIPFPVEDVTTNSQEN